jgi:hypothetical protein
MGHKNVLEAAIARLRSQRAVFGTLELNDPMGSEIPALLTELGARTPQGALLDFYREMDGASLAWGVSDPTLGDLGGGLTVPSAMVAFLRGGAKEGDAPLEGVLWSGDEEPGVLKRLQRMYILNSVPGRNEFVTFIPDEDPDRAYFVEDGEIRPLTTNLGETLELLMRYAGADGLLRHLAHADWKERVGADAKLRWLVE